MRTVSPGTVTVKDAADAPLLTEVAVNVTVRSAPSGVGGAVYVVGAPLAAAVGETVPQGSVLQDSVQVTPLFASSLTTVAVNCVEAPPETLVLSLGAIDIAIPPATVTLVVAEADESLEAVAVMVTARSACGRVVGA
jgi:hypothetical protein